jgi:hypothetical protein
MLMSKKIARVMLPYCMERYGEDVWSILNREYVPIGRPKGEFDPPVFWKLTGFTPLKQEALSCKPMQHRQDGVIYLFDDGCAPWLSAKDMKNYLAKYAKLLSVRATIYEKEIA